MPAVKRKTANKKGKKSTKPRKGARAATFRGGARQAPAPTAAELLAQYQLSKMKKEDATPKPKLSREEELISQIPKPQFNGNLVVSGVNKAYNDYDPLFATFGEGHPQLISERKHAAFDQINDAMSNARDKYDFEVALAKAQALREGGNTATHLEHDAINKYIDNIDNRATADQRRNQNLHNLGWQMQDEHQRDNVSMGDAPRTPQQDSPMGGVSGGAPHFQPATPTDHPMGRDPFEGQAPMPPQPPPPRQSPMQDVKGPPSHAAAQQIIYAQNVTISNNGSGGSSMAGVEGGSGVQPMQTSGQVPIIQQAPRGANYQPATPNQVNNYRDPPPQASPGSSTATSTTTPSQSPPSSYAPAHTEMPDASPSGFAPDPAFGGGM